MIQNESPDVVAELNAAYSLILPAHEAAKNIANESARETLQSSLIDLGLQLQAGNYAEAFDIIRDITNNHGFPFLNLIATNVLKANKIDGHFNERVEARQEYLSALWAERRDLFVNYINPLSEKVMLLTTHQVSLMTN